MKLREIKGFLPQKLAQPSHYKGCGILDLLGDDVQVYKSAFSKILLILLSVVLMGVNSCSQQANVNMRHIGNFFSYPFKALADLASGNTDGQIKEKYENYVAQAGVQQRASCGRDPASINNPLLAIQEEMRGKYCQCSPWQQPAACEAGTDNCCHISLCPREIQCPLVCPENISILRGNRLKSSPDESGGNYFNFLNSAHDTFINEVRPIGRNDVQNSIPSPAYNLGMISARRKFNELATFTQGNVPIFEGDNETEKQESKKEYYQELIDDIFDNKARNIPGYQNLKEFSSDPLVTRYLKQKIAAEWEDKAIGNDPFGETEADPEKQMDTERGMRLLHDVGNGIDQLGSVTVGFGYKTDSGDDQKIQALEAYKIYEEEDKKVICVHDPNLPAGNMDLGAGVTAPTLHVPFSDPPKICFPHMIVNADGKTYYKGKVRQYFDPPRVRTDEDGIEITERYHDELVDRELFDVRQLKNSDRRDAVKQIPRLAKSCREDKGCVNAD